MRITGYFFIALLLFIPITVQAQTVKLIDTVVVPLGYDVIPGTGIFVGPLSSTQRTYQLLINEDQLASHLGKNLVGISFRLTPGASSPWPATDIVYTNYDIRLSGSVHPSQRSLTFADNVVGPQTQVRSGSLNISAGTYQIGGSPNVFGKEITFDTIYTYAGGHLLIEIRHTGSNGTSSSVDALTTSTAGYGTSVSAAWTGNYAGTSGSQGNFGVTRISAEDPIPVELTSFTVSVIRNNAELRWSTASESNNYGFEIERLSNNSWTKIGFVKGAGTTTESNSYSYTDAGLTSGKYSYRLRQIDNNGIFSYSQNVETVIDAASEFSLEQNYPNPFNPVTAVEFSLPEKTNVIITVYNSIGEQVAVMLDEERESGYHKISFDASNLMSGVYFYEIKAGSYISMKKMLLLK